VKLLEPAALFALVAVVFIAAFYVVRLPFRRRYVIALPTTAAVAAIAPRRPGWQRHASTALFLVTLAAVVVAFARPVRDDRVPRRLVSVIVVLDTSNSMRATDVAPQRLVAARRGALQFADDVPRGVRIGLVTFAGTATVAVPPTSDRDEFRAAIENVEFEDGTSLGDGILAALTAVEDQLADLELTEEPRGRGPRSSRSAVVLLSDGQETLGSAGQIALDAARRAKVPVTTIAYGTSQGAVTLGGARLLAPVNRRSLADVAAATRGEAFVARPGTDLDSVYEDVVTGLGTTKETRDLTPWTLGIALVLGMAALLAAFAWGQRVP
jgi:Ca-activated chloride channel family protein